MSTQMIKVSLPITTRSSNLLRPPDTSTPSINDFIISPDELEKSSEHSESAADAKKETDHYYLPDELTQTARMIQNGAADVFIPIRQVVILAIYINETGSVDDVAIEESGLLTEEEQNQLKNAFKKSIFLPGYRFERAVKSLYRIKLAINRRTFIRQ